MPLDARPTQRRIMAPSRQRLTLRVKWRTAPIRFSMQFVVARQRCSRVGRPRIYTVSVSSSPSRRLAAASTWPVALSQLPRALSWRRPGVALALGA